MKNKIRVFILAAIAFSMTSCYNYQKLRLLQESRSLPVYEKAPYKEYHLRVNDELIYRLITSDETISDVISSTQSGVASTMNQSSHRVYKDGTIDLPFIDSIHVAGLTLTEAERAIEARFKEILPDAVVKLSLANRNFTVLGDAGTGIFPLYKDKLTIFEALATSGDFLEQSDRKHIRIIRETENGTKIIEFDIRPKSLIDSKYYYVYPNDIIYVQREFSSFYKVNNYSSLISVVSLSISLLFNVLIYSRSSN